MRVKFGNALLLAASVALSLIAFEVGARLFTAFPAQGPRGHRISHKVLGHVTSPSLPGIDARGFRNPRIIDNPEIFALGDSYTYGYNVASSDSWPHKLAEKLNVSIYNYGTGDYGILQYFYLFNEAIKAKPRHIILALYFANDLRDYCSIAILPYWRSILSRDNLDFEVCAVSEDKTNRGAGDGKGMGTKSELFDLLKWFRRIANKTALGSAFDQYVVRNVLRALRENTSGEQYAGIRITRGDHTTYISSDRINHHMAGMDLSEPRIRAALAASEVLFGRMIEAARKNGVNFVVMFIPSKERVFSQWVIENEPVMSEIDRQRYSKLIRHEEGLLKRFQAFFLQRNIKTHDALVDMRRAIATGQPLYPSRDDGHPIELGYQAYAEAAKNLIDISAAKH